MNDRYEPTDQERRDAESKDNKNQSMISKIIHDAYLESYHYERTDLRKIPLSMLTPAQVERLQFLDHELRNITID